MFIRSMAAVAALLVFGVARAWKPEPKPPSATANADVYATAKGGSAQANQSQSQTAKGGEGGSGVAEADASNIGNAQTVNYVTPRQVPPVFLPALMVSECGAGANVGAADGGGAGAFGVVWTTKRCYALRSALNFFAIGEYETGCRLLTYVNREALKAIDEKPDCAAIASRLNTESQAAAPTSAVTSPFDLSNYATKDDLERAFRKSQSK